MTGVEGFARDYRVAFLAHLARRGEASLHRGYELGRAAVTQGLGILEVVYVHHEVLLEVLRETPTGELADVAAAASEFLCEVLATSDMAQRALLRPR
ncbi:phosphatase RsbU N-terminal domain-containing protein [Geodermatophilus sp. SYSU D00766]